jgi:hypothetical protein
LRISALAAQPARHTPRLLALTPVFLPILPIVLMVDATHRSGLWGLGRHFRRRRFSQKDDLSHGLHTQVRKSFPMKNKNGVQCGANAVSRGIHNHLSVKHLGKNRGNNSLLDRLA